ncbi:right-handed parallel beta-helix repeat-containing protein [Lederbergia citri]|uniref:Right-handed parallel beta-helix repeat-containing protein n=1 Tax=Lederbergia citri TaxID=2833580 RepID=A0A942YJ14_9BACI|nr:right-handed parallel beta-helix repeat-containing protein [Lederbergia citri]MBS4197599.1 right-handed parallel beta-helix repeat-containing protein [Lederbergia citri]
MIFKVQGSQKNEYDRKNDDSAFMSSQDSLHLDKIIEKTFPTNNEENVYSLELKKWRISNDGTHPKETTKGLNDAIKWAQKEGYTTFYVPPGTYLICKGKEEDDTEARINLVSNMTFLLDEKAIIQKESNGFEIYSTLFLDSEVENVRIKGGTIRGDRETHDYSQKGEHTGGSHEWGNGIDTAGAQNIEINGVKIEKFTGDGIEIGGTTIYGNYITEEDIEIGGIDENGKLIPTKGKVRTKNNEIANFNNPIYKNPHYRNIMMWLPEGVDGNYDIFFYRKDHSLIRAERDLHFNSTWGYSEIPEDAVYFRAVFNSDSKNNIIVNRMTVAITKNITITNCEIGYNRRQGITVGASDGVNIVNNKIHNTNGTAPESGIDIEPGFYPAINTNIKGNQFLNNTIHMVFAYGGNALIEENYFGPNVKDGIGFSINPAYYGATVKNNTFDHTDFTTWGNTNYSNNTLLSSLAVFEGGTDVIVHGVEGIDSSISFNQTVNGGIKADNITLSSTNKSDINGGIYVYGKQIHLKDVTLTGSNVLSGDGNNASIYDNVKFNNTVEMNLALGTYKDCYSINGLFSLNVAGKIVLENCKFEDTTFYTYNTETEAAFYHSTFENEKIEGPIILALEAKKVNVLYNKFNVNLAEDPNSIIQIGRDASEHDPTKVFNSTIKGNTFISKQSLIGIDTINGGIGSFPYLIEDNTLTNVKLNLKENDVNRNNRINKKK